MSPTEARPVRGILPSTAVHARQAREKKNVPFFILDLDKKSEVIDYIETFTLNTDSCFAVFS
jgi:hypothetical protein